MTVLFLATVWNNSYSQQHNLIVWITFWSVGWISHVQLGGRNLTYFQSSLISLCGWPGAFSKMKKTFSSIFVIGLFHLQVVQNCYETNHRITLCWLMLFLFLLSWMARREQFFNVHLVWDFHTSSNFILWGPVELAHVMNVTLSLLIFFPSAVSLFLCISDFVWQDSPKQTAFIGVVDFIWVQTQLFKVLQKSSPERFCCNSITRQLLPRYD
jgi:hypothetical protein